MMVEKIQMLIIVVPLDFDFLLKLFVVFASVPQSVENLFSFPRQNTVPIDISGISVYPLAQ